MTERTETFSKKPYLYVLAGVLLWSTGGLFIKYTTLDAFTVNFGRSLFAAIVVAAFTYKKGLRPDAFTLFSAFLYAATLSCFVYANKNTTAANAIFLQYTAPIYILVLSPFVLKEKFHIRDAVTVALCLVGMSLFFTDTGPGQATAPNIVAGNTAALISGVFFGLYILLLSHPKVIGIRTMKSEPGTIVTGDFPVSNEERPKNSPPYKGGVAAASADGVVLSRAGNEFQQTTNPQSQNPAISVFYGNLIIVAVMLPFVISSFVHGQTIKTPDILAVAYLGIFQIGIAYILFTTGIAHGVRSMDASLIGFIEPLLNPIWVAIFVGEKPSTYAILGGAIIIATILVHTFSQYRRARG